MCASCHGANGEGNPARAGPALTATLLTEAQLVTKISNDMPSDNPGSCKNDCATNLAHFIITSFVPSKPVCSGAASTTPRGLRLLTNREYLNTVRDLVAVDCNAVQFSFDPKGVAYSKVHVAGSFNNWAATIAAGGWAMTYSPTTKLWTTTHPIPAGAYTYKFVTNETTWLTDPANPQKTADGFANSILNLTCTMPDPTTAFTPDTRPQGFAFDDNGPGRVVLDPMVQKYHDAAASLTDTITQNIRNIVACDFVSNPSGCASTFVGRFGQRAFRRPLTAAEATRYTAIVTGAPDFVTGAVRAVRGMLASPNFLYRSEAGAAQPDGSYKLDPYEIASALSYQFWGSMPDQALFDAAAAGMLGTSSGIETQARRLLADPRARAVMATFAEQWLGSENVTGVSKLASAAPTFNATVAASMRNELQQFVTYVIFDGTHTYDELLTANYSFLDGTLGAFYGVSGPTGSTFTKTTFTDGQHSGVLTQGSVLSVDAHSDQSAPVLRGKFVRTALLCQTFALPPPNAGSLPPVDPNATTRERFSQHSADPFCAGCHKYLDPVGFGFERFDMVGLIRSTENGKAIDSSGNMNDVEGLGTGTSAPFSTVPQLAATLAASGSAKSCFVRQYFRFARGYLDGANDACTIQDLATKFGNKSYDIRELMVAVATSPDFVVRH
jgi:hypothetical protein